MKYLYKFYEDCGRMGSLDGIFVADESEIKDLIGKNVHFGECLGKHSDIDVDISEKNFTKKDLDFETIEKVSKILGNTLSGWNPVQMKKDDIDENNYDEDGDEM